MPNHRPCRIFGNQDSQALKSIVAEGEVRKSNYRPEIDGLRALAVIAVIVNHINKNAMPSGYLGVDIFFVMSGFVITSSLANHRSESLQDFFLGFYARRLKRLIPALALFTVITSLLICFFNPEPYNELGLAWKGMFGISNLSLYGSATDYFASSTELNPFTHTWSLGVEEQFYLVYPFLIWFSGFGRATVRGESNLLWVTGLLSVASLIGFLYLYQVNQPAAYFLMPPRFWEIGAGSLLFLGLRHPSQLLRWTESLPPLAVAACLVAILWLPLELAVIGTLAVVIATAVLIACLRKGTLMYAVLTNDKITYIGLISYSLYLWHWGILSISRWTIGIRWWSIPVQVALMLALGILSYRYVETPLRRAEWSAMRWKTIGFAISASAGTAGLVIGLQRLPISLYTGEQLELAARGVESLLQKFTLSGTGRAWQGRPCVLTENSEAGKIITSAGCTLGDPGKAKRRVLVLGNSFSAAFVQAFSKLVKRDGYAITITSSWGASPVKGMDNFSAYKEVNTYYWEQVAPSLMKDLRRGDLVFLINDLSDLTPAADTGRAQRRRQQFKRGLEELSQELSSKGVHLAVLHGLPFAREANCKPVNAIPQWFRPPGNHCPIPNKEVSLVRRSKLDMILREQERTRKITVVDLFDIFCSRKECTYLGRDGEVLYRDEHSHPSVEAARLSANAIRKALMAQ
ncbi:acyltransferase [Synechococcus sp. CBW1002]|nr:acyltransferase [Synechococcus sp. CBW1002]